MMWLYLGRWLAAPILLCCLSGVFPASCTAASLQPQHPPQAAAAGAANPAAVQTTEHDATNTPLTPRAALPDSVALVQTHQQQLSSPELPGRHTQQATALGAGVYAALAAAYGVLRTFVRPGAAIKWPYGELSDADERKLWMDASGGGADGLGGSGVGGRPRRRRVKLVYAKAAHLRQKHGVPEAISVCVARKYWSATQFDRPRGDAEIVQWRRECLQELAWRSMGLEQRQALALNAAADLQQRWRYSPAMALCVAERLLPMTEPHLPSPDDTTRRRQIVQWCREAVAMGYDPAAIAERSGGPSSDDPATATDPVSAGRSQSKSRPASGSTGNGRIGGFVGGVGGYTGIERDPVTGTPVFPGTGASGGDGASGGSSGSSGNSANNIANRLATGHGSQVIANGRKLEWGKLFVEALRGEASRSSSSGRVGRWTLGPAFPGQSPGSFRGLRASKP